MPPCLSVGPASQTQVPATVHNLPATIPPNGSVSSNLITVDGYTKIAVGLTSSQNGLLSIQRYLDPQGAVAVGAPVATPIVAGTPLSLTVNDGEMFSSFEIVLTNSSASTALIGNLAVAVGTDPTSQTGAGNGSYETATSTTVAVPATTGGAVLLAQNLTAKYRAFRNPETNSAAIWLTVGTNPQIGSGLLDLQPGDIYEMTIPDGNLSQGVITAISANGTQNILVTEGV
jgi:hypothetical protein